MPHVHDAGAVEVPQLLCVIQVAGSPPASWSIERSCQQLVQCGAPTSSALPAAGHPQESALQSSLWLLLCRSWTWSVLLRRVFKFFIGCLALRGVSWGGKVSLHVLRLQPGC